MSWVYGIILIIILIFLINIVSYFIPNPISKDLVGFINGNIILIIIISFLFFLGSFFYFMGFPIDLAFPPFDAVGGALLVYFIINLIVLIDKYLVTGIGNILQAYSYIFSIIIFFIVIIFGYISILQHQSRRMRHHNLKRDDDMHDRKVVRRTIRRTY